MVQELEIESGKYISSKKASEVSGYTQDYIGQLSRGGLIDATRIGGLWYVNLESLTKYKEKADQFVPTPPPPLVKREENDSIVSMDGRTYVSTSRAAQLTGYNPDYVGQLARSGKVLSRQIGNRWYVESEGIAAHKKEKDALLAAVQSQSVGLTKPQPVITRRESQDMPLEPFYSYLSDSKDLLPISNRSEIQNIPFEAGIEAKRHERGAGMPITQEMHSEGPAPMRVSISKNLSRASAGASEGLVASPIRVIEHGALLKGHIGQNRRSTEVAHTPIRHKKQHKTKRTRVPVAAAGLFTIVILLAFGIKTITGHGTFAKNTSISKVMSAEAGSAFDKFGVFLENLVPEMEYTRTLR